MEYDKGGLQKSFYTKDEVVLRDCPLCESKDYQSIYDERGSIGVAVCKNCRLIYTNPMVKNAEKNYCGEEEKYYDEMKLILTGKAKSHRDKNYLDDLKTIERIKPTGNFLDIGSNIGLFLRHTRGKKWNVVGLEPSTVLADMAHKHFGLNVKNTYLKDAGFKGDSFDIVTMTDVFEHIDRPRELLSQIRNVIKSDGILFIKVPNGNYNLLKLQLAKITGRLKDYDIFDSYEHLTHYTHATLEKMLKDCGFKIKKAYIGKPIQLPAWHKHVGHYYEYSSPWTMDPKNHILRILFYWISRLESLVRFGRIGHFASNITIIASKV